MVESTDTFCFCCGATALGKVSYHGQFAVMNEGCKISGFPFAEAMFEELLDVSVTGDLVLAL